MTTGLFWKIVHILPVVAQGAGMTVLMTIAIVTIGLIGGFISGFITCERVKIRWITPVIHTIEFLVLGMPVFIQCLIIYLALPNIVHMPISPAVAGIITLGLTAIARFAEIVRHDIDHIPEEQWESCQVLGYSLPLILWSIIMPQIIRCSFKSFVGESMILLKETYIVSILGTIELTKVAMNLGSKELDPLTSYIVIAFVYLAIICILTYLANLFQARFLKTNGHTPH